MVGERLDSGGGDGAGGATDDAREELTDRDPGSGDGGGIDGGDVPDSVYGDIGGGPSSGGGGSARDQLTDRDPGSGGGGGRSDTGGIGGVSDGAREELTDRDRGSGSGGGGGGSRSEPERSPTDSRGGSTQPRQRPARDELTNRDPAGGVADDEVRRARENFELNRDPERVFSGTERVPLWMEEEDFVVERDPSGDITATPTAAAQQEARRRREEELREQAAADDPLRDAEDFVVEDGQVRRRARPFFEEQREALGLNPPEESTVRRELREGSEWFSTAARNETPAGSDISITEEASAATDIDVGEEIPLNPENIRIGGAETFNVPGAVLGAAGTAEQAANVGQAEFESRSAGYRDIAGGDTSPDAVQTAISPGTVEGTAAAEEQSQTAAAGGQLAGEIADVATSRPGLLFGGAVAGAAGGLAAGRALDAPRSVVRSTRVRRAADSRIDFSDLESPSRGSSELPEFEVSPSAPTSEAVDEVQRRARQTDRAAAPDTSEGALFHTTDADMRGDLMVQEGSSELPGLWASPDPSPLGLTEGGSGGLSSFRPRLPNPLRADSDQIVSLPADDIRGMPSDAQGAAYAVRDADGDVVETGLGRREAAARAESIGGERAPDPTTGGYEFLSGQADPEAAYVRPSGSRTSELEAIYAPGGQFAESGLVAVDMPSGRTVPLRRFDRAGTTDVESGPMAGVMDGDTVTAETLPTTRISRSQGGEPVTPIGAPAPATQSPAPTTETTQTATRPVETTEPAPTNTTTRPPSTADGLTGGPGSVTGGSPSPSPTTSPTSTTPTSPSAPSSPTSGGPTSPSSPTSPPSSAPSQPSGQPSSPTGPPSAPPSSPFGSPTGPPSSPTSPPLGPPGSPTQPLRRPDPDTDAEQREERRLALFDPTSFVNPFASPGEVLGGSFGGDPSSGQEGPEREAPDRGGDTTSGLFGGPGGLP
jgi:hypothetical protein